MQRIRLIMSNASTAVMSTQDVTDRAYNAWLWSFGSAALDILNLASFVVPFRRYPDDGFDVFAPVQNPDRGRT